MTCAPGHFFKCNRQAVDPRERLWRGPKRRNPPPGSLPAVGWKLFASSLAVSPRAESGNSPHRRSRHGSLGGHSLRGGGQHIGKKNNTRERRDKAQIWETEGACAKARGDERKYRARQNHGLGSRLSCGRITI